MAEFFQWCQSSLQAIIDHFTSIWNLILSLVGSLLDFLKMIPSVISMISSAIGFLPGMLSLFAVLSLTVSITYLIVGRNNQ